MPDIKEPIKIYENDMQLQSSLKEWQARLFLDGWCITVELVDKCSADEYGTSGLNTHLPIQKTAYIEILKNSFEIIEQKVFIGKQPQELVLVHELLHCKFGVVYNAQGTYEAKIAEYHDHSLLEEISKSLIMAKYDLSFDWFKEPYIK